MGLLRELVMFLELFVRTGKEVSQSEIFQINIRQILTTCRGEFNEQSWLQFYSFSVNHVASSPQAKYI